MPRHTTSNTQHAPTSQQITPKLLAWFAVHARDLPWRRTRDPYAIWVSEIMLQQTQVKTVISYWERWMRALPTIESLAAAKPEKIHKLWEGLGYYTRVRNMQKAAQLIVGRGRAGESLTVLRCYEWNETQRSGRYSLSPSDGERGRRGSEDRGTPAEQKGSEVRRYIPLLSLDPSPHPMGRGEISGARFPESFDDILALPGIGRYTAGAISSIAFNQPTPILDGNVIRVLTRLHGIATDPREKNTNAHLWQLAEELVCAATRNTQHATRNTPSCSALNQSLMELGALVCTPRSPSCNVCPLASHCVALRKNLVAKIPRPKQRPEVTVRRVIAFIISRSGRYFVRQRPGDGVNAHLWEFPNVEARAGESVAAVAAAALGVEPAAVEELCVVKHSITRYRMSTEAHRVSFGGEGVRLPGEWRTLAQVRKLPFTSAHRRIADELRES